MVYTFIRTYQLDMMLALSAVSLCFGLLLFITKFLEKRRKYILIFMEFVATFLLFFDRMSYLYVGDITPVGFVMVRVSNFFVFFLTPCVIFGFNLYINYVLTVDVKLPKPPKQLIFVSMASLCEMILVIFSQITGLFYYFDENNVYHRGSGFIICYIIPVLCPLIQYTVIKKYRELISKWMYISMVLYIFVPIVMGIIQIFAYGISLVNTALVLVSISMYVFTYLDINEAVMNAHEHEMKILQDEKKSAKRLFDQTASAFMAAVEERDEFSEGHATRVSNLARRIAILMGKSEEECDEIYYAALLHNVGLVSIPDEVLEQKEKLTDEERKIIERVPVLSGQILSSIKEYPTLTDAALYSHERYDGSGYPMKLKGESIPEVARIVGAVDAYDAMTSKRSYRGPLPMQTIREEFIRQSGIKYDPVVASLLVRILDEENNNGINTAPTEIEKEITCGKYREAYTVGVPIIQEITKIKFNVSIGDRKKGVFSEPALILFDAFDGYVHDNKKAIEAYHYMEYGEIWFDGKVISTSARNIKVQSTLDENQDNIEGSYEVITAKYEDHIKLELISPRGKVEVIAALPDRSKAAYISITGENCIIDDIQVELFEKKVHDRDIPKIVEGDSYINRLVSDVANVQIDQYRSGSTEGIPIVDKLKLDFHTMSLPSASLVWHCPYIVLYSSDDKKVQGKGYKEFALIKINGEISADKEIVDNKFSMKKKEKFPGWDAWKELNKVGMECSVSFVRRGNTVWLTTENMGISIENTLTILDGTKDIYVTLSGDQVALTDIRIG